MPLPIQSAAAGTMKAEEDHARGREHVAARDPPVRIG
jgi:hypothetical protein